MSSPTDGPAVVPGAYYADLGSAIDWLVSALGFRVVASYDGPNGKVVFAELAWRNGIIFVSTIPADGAWSRVGKTCICLVAENVDAVENYHRLALKAGAKLLRPLRRTSSPAFPDGVMGFDLEDPEGNLWTVSEYQPATLAARRFRPAPRSGVGSDNKKLRQQ
ncbi:VOC family protein [Hyphomicrobium sp. 802]|uniref:VOC family protein n=1 Tax=Hyphomicrobium sp. 802 TaxID=1112272 RepID=UPI0004ACFF9C|nr:VOC family protein [Hyphomicrobium sp. 802]